MGKQFAANQLSGNCNALLEKAENFLRNCWGTRPVGN